MPLKVGKVNDRSNSSKHPLFAPTQDAVQNEITQAPRRVTRSRSRENKVQTVFFKITDSSTQSTRKPESTAKTKKSKKSSKASKLATSDSEWEDLPNSPHPAQQLSAIPGASRLPGRRLNSRQPTGSPKNIPRSPIHHVTSAAASVRPSRAQTRLQQFRHSPPAPKEPPTPHVAINSKGASTSRSLSESDDTASTESEAEPQSSTSFLSRLPTIKVNRQPKQKSSSHRSHSSSNEDGEDVQKIKSKKTTEKLTKSTILSRNISIFDPAVNLTAVDTPHPNKDQPTASSSRYQEESLFDDDTGDSDDTTCVLPPKISARKQDNQRKVQFQSRSDRLEEESARENHEQPGSTSRASLEQYQTPEQSRNESGLGPSLDTSPGNISDLSKITIRRYPRGARTSEKAPKSAETSVDSGISSGVPVHQASASVSLKTSFLRSAGAPSSAPIPQFLTADEQFQENLDRASRHSPPPLQERQVNPIMMPHTSRDWATIEDFLKSNVYSFTSFKKSILNYRRETSLSWTFRALEKFISSSTVGNFHKSLVMIKRLALQMQFLEIPVCVRQTSSVNNMSPSKIACLLANGFLCIFPEIVGGPEDYGGKLFNFSKLFEAIQDHGDERNSMNEIVQQKISCIVEYFSAIGAKILGDFVSIERFYVLSGAAWWSLETPLSRVSIQTSASCPEGGVEILETCGVFGGDLFGFKIEEEEINFLIHPEMIVARLFVEPLGEGEALFFWGVRQFSDYEGFGSSFKFKGPSVNTKARNFGCVRKSTVEVANSLKREDLISNLDKLMIVCRKVVNSREKAQMIILKALKRLEDWGNPTIKFLTFLMATSFAGISGVFSIQDDVWNEEIQGIQELLIAKKINIQTLFAALCEYEERLVKPSLYFFLKCKFTNVGD